MNAPRTSLLLACSPVLLALVIEVFRVMMRVFQWQIAPIEFYLLLDSDVLLRLSIVRDLLQGNDWMNHILPRLNAPFGAETPWTRPVDILLLLCTTPFLLFSSLATALILGAFLYSTLILLACVWVMSRIIRLTGSFPAANLLLVLGLLFYPAIMHYFHPVNVDHHSLLVLLSLSAFYFATTIAQNTLYRGASFWMGAITGLGIWVSVEFQLVIFVIFGWLGWQWLLTGERRWANAMLNAASAGAVVVLLAILSEHPASRFAEIRYDSVSILHLAIMAAGAAAGGILLLCTASCKAVLSRAVAAGLTASALFAALLIAFPKLLQGPMANVSAEMRAVFISTVHEMQPLLHSEASIAAATLLFPLLALLLMALHRKQKPSPYQWLLLIAFSFFLVVSLSATRLACYLGPFALLLLIHLLHLQHKQGKWSSLLEREVYIVAAALLPLYIIASGELLSPTATARHAAPAEAAQDTSPATSEQVEAYMSACMKEMVSLTESGALQAAIGEEAPFASVLTHNNWGGYLLWRSPYGVVASNYHRDEHGFIDAYNVLRQNKPETTIHILRARKIAAVMMCDAGSEDGLSNFLYRLRNTQPDWAEEVPLSISGQPTQYLHLYRIRQDKL